MCEMIITGQLSVEYFEGYHKLKLMDSSGFKFDVIGRILEFYENHPKCKFRVSYHITDNLMPKSKVVVGFMKVGYGKNEYQLDEYSSGVDYDCILKVGKCDIYRDLIICNGKYVSIEVTPK